MARPLAQAYPDYYGYKKRVNDSPDYMRTSGTGGTGRAVIPAQGSGVIGFDSQGGAIRQASSVVAQPDMVSDQRDFSDPMGPGSGGFVRRQQRQISSDMSAGRRQQYNQNEAIAKQQIFDTNMQRRAAAQQQQSDNYAQADRNYRANAQNDLEASKAISRDADWNKIKQQNRRVIIPAVPSGSASTASGGDSQGPFTGGNDPSPLRLSNGAAPGSAADQLPTAPIAAPAPAPVAAVPPVQSAMEAAAQALANDAKRLVGYETGGQPGLGSTVDAARQLGSTDATISGPARDALNSRDRVKAIYDVQGGTANFVSPTRTTPGGVAGIAPGGQGSVQYPRPKAPVPVVPPVSVTPEKELRTAPRRHVVAEPGSRLETLRAEAKRGQDALDRGNSLESQQRAAAASEGHRRSVELATAQSQPRTGSQAKPDLDPQHKANIANAKGKLATAQNTFGILLEGDQAMKNQATKDAKAAVEKAQAELDKIVGGSGGGQPDTAPPPNAVAVSPDGKRFKIKNPDGTFSWTD